MKKMVINYFLLLTISAVLGEKPIRGRPFSQPLFLRQEVAPAEQPPYQPSGWKPEGQRLILPERQETGVPHTVYGPPSSEAPPSEYGPPSPTEPEQTSNAYGPPDQNQPEPLEPQQGGYPAASGGPPGESASGGYDYPRPQQPLPDPNNQYGSPPDNQFSGQPQQPDNQYGAPLQPQQPGNEYGAPAPQPDNGYGAPPENGQIPVDQGASERLRQQQFVQQLPGFEPSRFTKPQRLRQNKGKNSSQKLQQLPQGNQRQQFRQQTNRNSQQQKLQSQQQQILAQNQQFAQKQQLYQTPQSANGNPNVAVATAVSGEYYVIEPNGRLQRVSYTTLNGKLVDGGITSGIKPEVLQNTNAPVYRVNEFNQLVKVNMRQNSS